MKHNKVESGSDLLVEGLDGLTVGQRLQKVMDDKKLTQQDIASLCGCTAGYIDGWQHDRRPIPSNYAVLICKTYNISVSWLLTGHSEKNITVGKDLGLCNQAINQLKDFKTHDEMLRNHTAVISIEDSSGEAETENFSPAEILPAVNALLTSTHGLRLLSLIYRYLFTNFDSRSEKFVFENNCHGVSGKTQIDSSLLRFATLRAVENCMEDLRKEQKVSFPVTKSHSKKESVSIDPLDLIPQNLHSAIYETDHYVYSYLFDNPEYTKTLKKELSEISELTKEMVEKEITEEMSLISEVRKELNLGEEEQPPVDVLVERMKMSDERILRDQKLDELAEKVRLHMKENNQPV